MPCSKNERDELLEHLDRARDDLLEAVRGLSEAQLDFQISPKCWSITGIVEHVGLVENAVLTSLLQAMTTAASVPAQSNVNETDSELLRKATDRSFKLEAPGQFHPTGKPMTISVEQFLAGRKKIVAFIQSTPLDLRHVSIQTRAFGPLDGHQRLLFLGAHSARHTEQIVETKSNPNFPA